MSDIIRHCEHVPSLLPSFLTDCPGNTLMAFFTTWPSFQVPSWLSASDSSGYWLLVVRETPLQNDHLPLWRVSFPESSLLWHSLLKSSKSFQLNITYSYCGSRACHTVYAETRGKLTVTGSLLQYVGSGDPPLVVKLDLKPPHLMSHLASPFFSN